MNRGRRNHRNDYYLDVSDFILTDPRQRLPSPLRPPVLHQADILTPTNLPLIIEVEGVDLSPYFQQGGQGLDIQFYDFTLEAEENQIEQQAEMLEQINQQNESENQSGLERQQIEQLNKHNSTSAQVKGLSAVHFSEVYQQLQKIGASENQLLQFVKDFLTDEDFSRHDVANADLEKLKQIATHNLRKVGPISWLERKDKILRYLEKKKRRVWKKKISYDCRKRVADNRLRVKGKFVTKKQACNLLDIQDMEYEGLKKILAKSSQ